MRLLNLLRNGAPLPKLRVEASADEATIYLYDAIGGWFGLLAADFVKELNALTAPTIHLRINSPGGDVFEARAIATAIKGHKSKVIAHVDSLAASAATYIALAADEVEIAKGAFFMIHHAWGVAVGTAEEMRSTADLVEKVDATILDDYEAKTGKTRDEIAAWMDAETWFTAEEAVEHGFADRVVGDEPKASARAFNLAAFKNAPKALTEAPAREYDHAAMERRMKMLERIAP